MTSRKILIIAGENSSDLHASNLVKAVREIDKDISFLGLGGSQMENAGVDLIANETDKRAIALRDQGKVEEAQRVMLDNAVFLENNANKLESRKLKKRAKRSRRSREELKDRSKWKKQRKMMYDDSFMLEQQRAW